MIKMPENVDAFAPNNPNNFVELPDGKYNINGPTTVAQFVNVFAQAYRYSGIPRFILEIRNYSPGWFERDGEVVSGAQGGTAFLQFVRNDIIPPTLTYAGTDIMKRFLVLGTAVRLGDIARLPAYKTQIATMDATWQDINEKLDVGFFFINRQGELDEYLKTLLNARMPAFRRAAISGLKSEENRPNVIAKLSDTDREVREMAIYWLDKQDVPNKPIIKKAPDGSISNADEIIRFWTSPPPT